MSRPTPSAWLAGLWVRDLPRLARRSGRCCLCASAPPLVRRIPGAVWGDNVSSRRPAPRGLTITNCTVLCAGTPPLSNLPDGHLRADFVCFAFSPALSSPCSCSQPRPHQPRPAGAPPPCRLSRTSSPKGATPEREMARTRQVGNGGESHRSGSRRCLAHGHQKQFHLQQHPKARPPWDRAHLHAGT